METSSSTSHWRRCSSCKKPIAFGALYWVCNVSTCNRKRTGLVFCNVSCWDAHLPLMNHREAWAEERKAPSSKEWEEIRAEEDAPKQRVRKPREIITPAPVEAPKPQAVVIRRRRGEE